MRDISQHLVVCSRITGKQKVLIDLWLYFSLRVDYEVRIVEPDCDAGVNVKLIFFQIQKWHFWLRITLWKKRSDHSSVSLNDCDEAADC